MKRILLFLFNVSFAITNEGSRCEKITIPICQGKEYNQTFFPNMLDHASQHDAAVEIQQFYPLVENGCTKLRRFICHVYVPVCTILDRAVPPCRSMCQAAMDECTPLLKRFGFHWPDYIACDHFPQYGLCIGELKTTKSLTSTIANKKVAFGNTKHVFSNGQVVFAYKMLILLFPIISMAEIIF